MDGLKKRTYLKRYSDEELCEAIENSLYLTQASRKLGCSVDSGDLDLLRRFIKENNISIDHFVKRTYLLNYRDDELIEAIENSDSLRAASKKLKCKRDSLARFAHENNISVEHCYNNRNTQYTLNENFFKDLNNELVIYWLGFIMADGSVNKNKTSMATAIHLAGNDRDHLLNFLQDVESNSILYDFPAQKRTIRNKEYDIQKSSTAKINSKTFSEDLIRLGCVPNKTKYGCQVSDLIPKDMLRHFIRGYFDGDGSVTFSRNNNGLVNLHFFILGDYNFLEKIREIMIKELDLNFCQISTREGVHVIQWGGNLQCIKILEWLYSDCVRWLPRKREKYDNFLEIYRTQECASFIDRLSELELVDLIKESENERDLFARIGYKNGLAGQSAKNKVKLILENNPAIQYNKKVDQKSV